MSKARLVTPKEIAEMRKKDPSELSINEAYFLLRLDFDNLKERFEILEAAHTEPFEPSKTTAQTTT